jgi:drug/metabolite transporter (DMT)-like permease
MSLKSVGLMTSRRSKRVDPQAPAYFIVLFGVLFLLWLLVVVNQPDLLPSTPRGWGLLSCALLGLGVSIYFLRRQSSVR